MNVFEEMLRKGLLCHRYTCRHGEEEMGKISFLTGSPEAL